MLQNNITDLPDLIDLGIGAFRLYVDDFWDVILRKDVVITTNAFLEAQHFQQAI